MGWLSQFGTIVGMTKSTIPVATVFPLINPSTALIVKALNELDARLKKAKL